MSKGAGILQRFTRKLLPQSSYPYFEEFAEQTDFILKALSILSVFVGRNCGAPLPKELAEAVKQLEKGCDKKTGEILSALDNSFITPLDREDVALIAHLNDDIMDDIEEAAVKLADYELPLNNDLSRFLNILRECANELQSGLVYLKSSDPKLSQSEKNIKALEHEADVLERKMIKESYGLDPVSIIAKKGKKLFQATSGECAYLVTDLNLKDVVSEWNTLRQYREVGEILERAVDNARRMILELRKIYTKFS